MKHIVVWAFLGSVVSCAGAGGTETDNPAATLKDFTASACKNHAASPGQQALLLASNADGLECVGWERSASGALTLQLLNFPEPCGEAYLGSASVAKDGAVELTAYKDTCAVYKCGLCVFDFKFELANIAGDQPLRLRIGAAACATAPTTFADELTLPIDAQDSGVSCRYLPRSPLEWYARGRRNCAQLNMPCGEVCDGADTMSCGAGLKCSEVAGGDSRCLAECSSDADCRGGLMACQDGLCQSAASW